MEWSGWLKSGEFWWNEFGETEEPRDNPLKFWHCPPKFSPWRYRDSNSGSQYEQTGGLTTHTPERLFHDFLELVSSVPEGQNAFIARGDAVSGTSKHIRYAWCPLQYSYIRLSELHFPWNMDRSRWTCSMACLDVKPLDSYFWRHVKSMIYNNLVPDM